MSTGYTSYIGDGCDFKTFAMQCARAFGACIDMRDESSSTPIPESFKPSNYHLEKKHAAEQKLRKFKSFKKEDWEKLAKKTFEEEFARNQKYIDQAKTLLTKYKNMLEKVRAWSPPTEEHQNLKRFMIEQIEGSIEFDCNTKSWEFTLKNIVLHEWQNFKEEQLARVFRDIAYHDEEYKKEVERARKNSEWVNALRESLK